MNADVVTDTMDLRRERFEAGCECQDKPRAPGSHHDLCPLSKYSKRWDPASRVRRRVVRASRLPLVQACAAAAVLPEDDEASGPEAERGTAVHDFLRGVATGDYVTALASVPEEHRDFCSRIEVSRTPAVYRGPQQWEFRVELRLGDWLLTGHIDCLRREGNVVTVFDVKTGRQRVTPESWQLVGYGLAVLQAGDTLVTAVVHVRDDGGVWVEAKTWTWLELQLVREDTETQLSRASPDATTRGDHCRWCKSYLHCPAQQRLLKQLARAPRLYSQLETPAQVLRWIADSRVLLDKLQAEVDGRSAIYPVALEDGSTWGPVATTTKRIKPVEGMAVLVGLFGGFAPMAVTPKITWDGIDAMLRAFMVSNPGTRIGSLKKLVAKRLDEAGAFEETTAEGFGVQEKP